MNAPRLLRLPKVSRAEADLSRNRHGHRDALPVGIAGLELRLRPAGSSGCGPDPLQLSLRFGDAAVELRIPAEPVRHALQELDPGLDPLERLPGDLLALLLGAWAMPALENWRRRAGRTVTLLDVSPCGDTVPVGGLHLWLSDGQRRWPVHLSCPAELQAALLAPWPLASMDCAALLLPAALRIGVTRLPFGVVSSLGIGDAILLMSHVSPAAAFDGLLVVAETWSAAIRRQKRDETASWMILEPLLPASARGREGWMMDRETPAAPAAAGLDEIPVMLTFEVGRLSMTLGELRRAGAGTILELGRAAGELVEIAAHGRPLGRGELVEIEGAVAVRIVRLFDDGSR